MKWIAVFMIALLSLPAYAQHTKGACAEGPGFRTFNGESIEDDGIAGNPLHGWVGYPNTGDPIAGMVIELQTVKKKRPVASVITDATGRFSFPKLKNGTYYLIGTETGYAPVRILLHINARSDAISCLVSEAL
jgi:hypothetical protein